MLTITEIVDIKDLILRLRSKQSRDNKKLYEEAADALEALLQTNEGEG